MGDGQTVVNEDNRNCTRMSKKSVMQKQTKLISVKYHLFHERFQGGTVLLQYCHAENMQTDLLLKALSAVKVDKYHQALMSFSLTWSQLSLSGGYCGQINPKWIN